MVIILQIDEKIIDFGGDCRAEELKLFWGTLNGQTQTADQLDRYVGDIEVKSRVSRKICHASGLTLFLASQVIQTMHRLERHNFLGQVGVHVD